MATTYEEWPTLEEVIASLSSEVVHVVRSGSGRVRDVVILDPSEPGSLTAGSVVLAVGAVDAVALVDRAGRCGVAAVVFRAGEEPPRSVLAAADAHALGVLTVPREMPWGQVYSLLRTAVTGSGVRGEAGVPLGDLFALADAVAASVGGPVTVEDPQSRVLAFSNLGHEIDEARRQTILGRGVPADWQRRLEEAGVPKALRSGTDVVRFAGAAEDHLAPRLAAPVRAGDELLGALWVAESGSPLGAEAEAALARAALVAATHLIYHRVSDDLKRRTRGALVREVLDGHVPSGDLPLRVTGPLTVLVFAVDARSSPVDPERILSVVSLYCEDAHPDAMCAVIDDRIWALLPGSGARAVAERIVERVELVMGVRLSAGIGSAVPRAGDVPRSRRAAAQALRVLERRGGERRIAAIDEVRAHAVLLELLQLADAHPSLLAGKVAALLAHDAERGTDHAVSLRAYLDCWGDMAAAARRCGVHVNTMRYRVRKIIGLFDLALDDPDERLVTELQLRLHDERRTSGSAASV